MFSGKKKKYYNLVLITVNISLLALYCGKLYNSLPVDKKKSS